MSRPKSAVSSKSAAKVKQTSAMKTPMKTPTKSGKKAMDA